MKLISNPAAAWKHYSTIALTTAGSLQGLWAGMPESIKQDLPDTVGKAVAWITFVVALLGLGGKFVDQSSPKDSP